MKSHPIRCTMLSLLVVALAATLASPAGAKVGSQESRPIPDRYIVVLEDSVAHPGNVADRHAENREAKVSHVYGTALKGYAAELAPNEVRAVEQDPAVAYIEPDGRGGIVAQSTPTGIDRIFAAANESLDIDQEDDARVDVDVAVFDTGIDNEHPDLDVVEQIDCQQGSPCTEGIGADGHGHGTHVAGTIGAIDNGQGVVGVAPGARLWGIKVVNNGGFGDFSDLVAAVDWVTAAHEDEDPENDIEVTNASLGYSCCTESQAFDEALEASQAAGVVHVAAAGNQAQPVKYLPGVNPDLITVSALADYDGKPGAKGGPTCVDRGQDDRLASFSNYGALVDVAAPGVCIYSTVPGGTYAYNWGTSMASPHVAGAAAILAAQDPPKSKEDVDTIRDMIVDEGNLEWEDTSGDGIQEPLLDVGNEANFALNKPPEATTGPATKVGFETVNLNASIDANLSETDYWFEVWRDDWEAAEAPSRTNNVTNPSFEPDLSGWESMTLGGTLERTESESRDGNASMAVSGSTPLQGARTVALPVSPSTTYAASAWVKAPLGMSFALDLTEAIAGGKYSSTGTIKGTGQWMRVSTTHAFGSGGDHARVRVKLEDEGTIHLDAVLLEAGGEVLPYFPRVSELDSGQAVQHEDGTYEMATPIYAPESKEGYAGEGADPVEVSEALKGLEAETTYHFRVFATNKAGGAEGDDEEFTTTAPSVYFDAESHPVTIAGTDSKTEPLELPGAFGGAITCDWVEFEGDAYAPSQTLYLAAELYECGLGSLDATVAMNECHFELGVLDSEPPAYEGSLGIGCPEGKEIVVEVNSPPSSKCTITYAPQGGGKDGVSLTSFGAGSERGIEAGFDEAPLTAKYEGGLAHCGVLSGEYTVGLSGTIALEGIDGEEEPPFAEPVGIFVVSPPQATTEAATELTAESATLNAKVNPNGLQTAYQFQYVDLAEFEKSDFNNATAVPASPKGIGSGAEAVAVQEAPEGLKPNTTYVFRVVATNEAGTTEGEGKTFQTPLPPQATTEAATDVTAGRATLNAKVNPKGLETTYQFEYVDQAEFEENGYENAAAVPASPKGIGSGSSDVAVSEEISGLKPDTAYTFRVVATNEAGSAEGEDESFETGSAPPSVWTLQDTATSPTVYLHDVSCASTSECIAVGGAGFGGFQRVAERWDGEDWSTLAKPEGVGALTAISCTSPTFCMAVSEYGETAQRFDGEAWDAAPLAKPEGAKSFQPRDVSCTSAAACVVVGVYEASGTLFAFSQRWDGEEWSLLGTPGGEEGGRDDLNAVSCDAADSCTALGRADGQSGFWKAKPLALRFDGEGWSTLADPESAAGELADISCVSPSRCTAVFDTAKVERFDGEGWSSETLSAPQGGSSPTLRSVSCAAADTCVAVGSYTIEGEVATLAEASWEGSAWEAQAPPNPETGDTPQLFGVSCIAADTCTAVGYRHVEGFTHDSFAERYSPPDPATPLAEMPVTEPFDNSSASHERFESMWSALGWAGGPTPKGQNAWGWGPHSGASTPSGAFYHPSLSNEGWGLAVAATMGAGEAPLVGRYLSLWLDMPNPAAAQRAGYELRFTRVSAKDTYDVTLAKWVGGTETKLASKVGYSFGYGDSLALVDEGGAVSAWTDTGSGFEELLGAEDATFEDGKAGLSGTGSNGRLKDFKVTALVPPKATTEAASEVGQTSATLNGMVDPEGLATDYYFQWSTDAELEQGGYAHSTAAEPAGSGTEYVAASEPLEGLEPGITYHFRAVAQSKAGTVWGKGRTFKTEADSGPGAIPLTEPFDGGPESLERFESQWSALGWAQGSTPKGKDLEENEWEVPAGWAPADVYPTLNGAYHSAALEDEGAGLAVAATLTADSLPFLGRHFSLWLDMPNPSAAERAGYELRFTVVYADGYEATLSKWVGGEETILASKKGLGYPFEQGDSLALLDEGGTVSAWTDTGSGFEQLLEAEDATFDGGKAGLSGAGGDTRLKDFKAGSL